MVSEMGLSPTYTWGIRLMATRNPVNSPVEIGSLSRYLQGELYIPGGDRWISEPSTVLGLKPTDPKLFTNFQGDEFLHYLGCMKPYK